MTGTTDTHTLIAARLEDAFARSGFAATGVAELRRAADVSLRTLYRHFPSRDAMVRGALEHRHGRFMTLVFDDLPGGAADVLEEIVARMARWMERESPHGCLFHGAVAAHPADAALNALLRRHKRAVTRAMASATGISDEAALLVLYEGLVQAWPVDAAMALEGTRRLGGALRAHADEGAG